ncbi:Pycsar system effector family protein [Streptomyces virginiae]
MTDEPAVNSSPAQAPITDPLNSKVEASVQEAISRVAADIARTDLKAQAIILSFSILLNVIFFSIPRVSVSPLAACLLGAGVLVMAASLLMALTSLRPSINKAGKVKGSYFYWADCSPEEVLEDVCRGVRVEQLIRLAGIARRKFRRLRAATDGIIISTILICSGMLASIFS